MDKNKTQTNKENSKEIIRKRFEGKVVSTKSDKTIVVKVERVRIHPKYQKRYFVSTKYQVHDEKNVYNEGDTVKFVECRPISKNKRWRVLYN
jgi:small subunit ribosomal protein S17